MNGRALVMGSNDSPYPLLPGPVRVFLDGAFTTTSTLPLVAPGEKLNLGGALCKLEPVDP